MPSTTLQPPCPQHTRRTGLALLAALFLPGAAITTVCAASAPAPFFACTDYHCDIGIMISLEPGQWQSVREIFSAVATPAAEREGVRRAVALLETLTGAITGTWRDKGGNYAGTDAAGQLDCISESKNTTTYLQLMHDEGLLRWHSVGERRLRRPWFFNEHWTAVLIDRSDGQQYAVDSWFLDNGQPPGLLPLDEWLAGDNPDE
jgi:hypothetical protein